MAYILHPTLWSREQYKVYTGCYGSQKDWNHNGDLQRGNERVQAAENSKSARQIENCLTYKPSDTNHSVFL